MSDREGSASSAAAPPRDPPGWPWRLRAYGVPTLLVAVALLQLGLVATRGLTRWKGGGFGMYSTPHYIQREVWFTVDSPTGVRHFRTPARTPRRAAVNECKRWTSRSCLERLARRNERLALRSIEIFEPRVEPDSFTLERHRLIGIDVDVDAR